MDTRASIELQRFNGPFDFLELVLLVLAEASIFEGADGRLQGAHLVLEGRLPLVKHLRIGFVMAIGAFPPVASEDLFFGLLMAPDALYSGFSHHAFFQLEGIGSSPFIDRFLKLVAGPAAFLNILVMAGRAGLLRKSELPVTFGVGMAG